MVRNASTWPHLNSDALLLLLLEMLLIAVYKEISGELWDVYCNHLRADKTSEDISSHPGQRSLAISPWCNDSK